MSETALIGCPVCSREFDKILIEEHVNKCLFLNASQSNQNSGKRINELPTSLFSKRLKLDTTTAKPPNSNKPSSNIANTSSDTQKVVFKPLAELMRPVHLTDIIGHNECLGPGTMLRSTIEQKIIPNMILWGPPGCGKTSFANVISHICKESENIKFVKTSATMIGINEVKEIVKIAKNDMKYKKKTVLFMDEIHRFNKLQQDTFLPHVENGTIILIGATTENPSFSLNNALISRCRIVTLQKLSTSDITEILLRAVLKNNKVSIVDSKKPEIADSDCVPNILVEEKSLQWLAEVCDGDARIALSALELGLSSKDCGDVCETGPSVLSLEDLKNGIKRTHMLYDRKGEEHYNTISAIHKSIRASDDNAALYWTTRALHGGEDPLFIARRLIRTASEDIGLSDQNALVEAVACLQGCQHIGMPECDVLLAQCAVRLARAPKSQEVYRAMKRCQQQLAQAKGPLPPIPLHLRNASNKVMKQMGYGNGYNLLHKDESGLTYLPDGMENVDFFNPDE